MKPILILCLVLFGFSGWLQGAENHDVVHGQRYDRLLIRNVMVIDGKGTPMRGPLDVELAGKQIAAVRRPRSAPEATAGIAQVIDGTGMYLLPGLINSHVHIHSERAGLPLPLEYSYKLWLACGQTSVRDVGSDPRLTLVEKRRSAAGEIIAPRLFLYLVASGSTADEIRRSVQEIAKKGADGVKIFGLDRDLMKACLEESRKLGLRVAHHVGVEETDAWDDLYFGSTSLEHWYGIPDAALDGSQQFPPGYSYNNENDRFRWAGRLWREADPAKLDQVLATMVEKGVAWVPTFAVYEACRDLQRAANLPWFREYLHPALERYFQPDPANHGSFFWNWTTEDEIYWKENYRIWMGAVRDFARKGGLVAAGDDAGFIYALYGFSLIRELELLQEAGFHPVDVVQAATGNGARLLGMGEKLGRVRPGYLADLILTGDNPLVNFKTLYPTGTAALEAGKLVQKGGIRWTIKDGIVYHVPTLLEEIRGMVNEARGK